MPTRIEGITQLYNFTSFKTVYCLNVVDGSLNSEVRRITPIHQVITQQTGNDGAVSVCVIDHIDLV